MLDGIVIASVIGFILLICIIFVCVMLILSWKNNNNKSTTTTIVVIPNKIAECIENVSFECSICLNTITDNDFVLLTECQHRFHKTCIEQVYNKVCPNCRSNFV